MMKITAGKFRNTRINLPKIITIRPTAARVRESIFNIINYVENESQCHDKRVLDLFAGSGILGFEALSREAQFCLFIEQNYHARLAIKKTIATLNLAPYTRISRRDATNLGKCAPIKPFNLIFADPPYHKNLIHKTLNALIMGKWIEKNALCVFEQEKNAPNIESPYFNLITCRTYGTTKISFMKKIC